MENVIFWILVLMGYFLPVIVAAGRKHQSGNGILVVNLFLGWTVLGWVLALAWSLSAVRPYAEQLNRA